MRQLKSSARAYASSYGTFLYHSREGFHSGVACYFIRLSGCDVGCQWCDVRKVEQYSHPLYKVEEMVEWVSLSGAVKVVVTGGEPLIHKLDILCDLLQ
ncbi:MAG: hypothetical protein CM15mP23_08150 [Cryomorphaceae bacterium]|nr:MAG: hypothetical protein CM15mP23_08150 [Cryomorphaceae bacterium]